MNRINIDMLGVRQCDACFPMTLRGTNTRADTKSLDALCWGNPSADIMILKSTPDPYEVKTGKLMSGKGGELLLDVMKQDGLGKDQVYITSSILCHYFPKSNLSEKEIYSAMLKCGPNLLSQIELVKPRFLITMGIIAAASVIPGMCLITNRSFHFESIDAITGREFSSPVLGGMRVIPIPDVPAYWEIVGGSDSVGRFINHFHEAVAVISERRNAGI
jgi:uracil-DNA glycosylase family 4